MNDGVTKKVIASRLLDSGLSIKFCKLANPLTIITRYEYERTPRVLVKLHISCFLEKLLVYHKFDRTKNEHTWSRRVS